MKQANWDKGKGILPAVIQEENSGIVLMLGYLSQESLELTLLTGEIHFFSRSKNRIWKKGETSGNTLKLVSIDLDCDQDSFLVKVIPRGATCHTGMSSCFTERETQRGFGFLTELEETIEERWMDQTSDSQSYVASLRNRGVARIAQKVGEEAVETVIASLGDGGIEEFKNESADLVFHLLVLLKAKGSSLSEIVSVLRKRSQKEA